MGRPSRAEERREEILRALLVAIEKDGLAKTSMKSVAASIGIDRTTLHHYFNSWEDLMFAGLDRVVEAYSAAFDQEVSATDPRQRLRQLIGSAFGAPFTDQTRSRILNEFLVVAQKDERTHRAIKAAYTEFEDRVIQAVCDAFPDVPRKRCVSAAFVLAQLMEGSSVFADLGFDASRRTAARAAAENILLELDKGLKNGRN
ncbi:MAG: TetR family transcriptional regulator [Rhodobiaceae bacterium]|nr:TetR family transcriptional regulator [Rhodobiaceae bacterium]